MGVNVIKNNTILVVVIKTERESLIPGTRINILTSEITKHIHLKF